MVDYIKQNFEQIMKWANLLFLFLFALHLFDFSDKYIILWCMISMGICHMRYRVLGIDKIFVVLAAAILLNGIGTYYYLGESLSYTWKDIFKMTVPTILVYPYIKGITWEKSDKEIENILLAIVFGTFCYSLLNYYSFLQHGFTEGRIWSEFWTLYPQNATHHSYWGCFIAGLCGYGIVCLCKRKWLKGSLIMILVVIENYIQIAVDNRMVLCVTFVALAASLFVFLLLNIKNKKRIQRTLLTVGGLLLLFVLMIALNVGGVQESSFFHSLVTRDGGIFKNIRFQMIYEAVTMLPSHWKGGADMWAAGWFWVHNYWLQVANVSGILPFVLWMIVNVFTIWDVVCIIRSPYISNQMKYLLIPLLTAIVAYLMMEPAGTESNRFIIFYVMLIALVKQIAQRTSKTEETK